MEQSVLDVVCILGVIALGALVALIGRGVEKLSPRVTVTAQRAATRGEDRS
jgi:hypothetical protein